MSKQWENFLLALIFIFAAFSCYAHLVRHHSPEIRADSPSAIADGLIRGEGYVSCASNYFPFCGPQNQQTAIREPVPVLIFALGKILLPNLESGTLIELAFYLCTAWMIFLLLRRFNRSTALIAVLLWITSVPVQKIIGENSGEIGSAFWFTTGILFFQKGREDSENLRHWIAAGFFFGLAAMSRSVSFGLAFGLCVGLLLERTLVWRIPFFLRIKPVLILAATLLMVMSPWVIRNQLVFGSPVLGSTLTGYNIFRHNSILEEKTLLPRYVGPVEAQIMLDKFLEHVPQTRKYNEVETQSILMKEGIRVISENPFRYFVLSAYRFLPLWFDFGVRETYVINPSALDGMMVMQQLLLIITGLIGAFQLRQSVWPLTLSAILCSLAYMAIASQIRYLVNIMPLVAGLSAIGISRIGTFFLERRGAQSF
ncbi:MAG: glycosyltransferase family 39 protein [Burkholderiales bacterium]